MATLSPGDSLRTPPPNLSTPGVRQSTTQLYTIKPGDTPQTIAARLGIPLASLLKSNPQIDHNGSKVPPPPVISPANGDPYYPKVCGIPSFPGKFVPASGPFPIDQGAGGLAGLGQD